jgi:hypothetical protein
MQHADVFDFRNNVIYNWNGNNASVFGRFALNSSAFGNVVNNLWLAGPEGGYATCRERTRGTFQELVRL